MRATVRIGCEPSLAKYRPRVLRSRSSLRSYCQVFLYRTRTTSSAPAGTSNAAPSFTGIASSPGSQRANVRSVAIGRAASDADEDLICTVADRTIAGVPGARSTARSHRA